MGIFDGLLIAVQPTNLLYVALGVVLGMIVGVLPGLGPVSTMTILLPMTFAMPTESAIIMLAGIYYGSMYGGTITSVLLRMPGESSAVVTTFDGYQMARQGRAGPALGIAAVGSFIGGTLAVVGLTLSAGFLARVALGVAPPEFAALTVLGLTLICYLGTRSFVKSAFAAGVGLYLATIGLDPITGAARFTFGVPELLNGIDIVAIIMGLFGISEILYNLENRDGTTANTPPVSRVWPSKDDFRRSRGAIGRGSVLGFLIGILPGGGGTVSSMISYALERRRAREPERFGRGAIEGVAGPETANNASSTAAFLPLLTLGLPSNVVMAMIFGALLLHDVTPGPGLISEHPAVFWGVIASMYVGNLLLLLLNIPFVSVFIKMVRLRYSILGPLTLSITLLGVYSLNNEIFDVWVAIFFGVVGYLMRKIGFEPGPLALALVLGVILERAFRQSLLISNGSLMIFLERPISAAILVCTAAMAGSSLYRSLRSRRTPSNVGDA